MSDVPLSPDLRRFLDLLSDGVLVVGADGRITLANTAVEGMFGWAPDALVGAGIETLLPERFRRAHAEHRAHYLANSRPRPMGSGFQFFALRRDGSEFPVDVSLAPIGDGLTVACVRDVTERVQLLEDLGRTEERYRQLVENASEVFYSVSFERDPQQGTLEFVSPQCQRITGRRPQEFLADRGLWFESVHPDDRQALVERTQAIIASQTEGTRAYRLRNHLSGEYRTVEDRVVPLIDVAGHVIGYQGTARDTTDRVRAEEGRARLEEQLRHSQRLETLGHLAGGVAHDFNNLLTIIMGCGQLARAETGDATLAAQHLDEVLNASRRATSLTHQLLAFGRRQPTAPRTVDLSSHIRSMEEMLRRTLPAHVAIVIEPRTDAWPVRVDPSQVDQVVLNLAVNARDAMPGGGSLTIATANVTLSPHERAGHADALPGDYVRLSVRDTGVGMDPGTLRHIFEPFFTTKPQGKGTGLGLASVYGIVRQNGGFIDVESAVGCGTTLTVHLPRAQPEEAIASVDTEVPLAPGHETVLLVDDEPSIRRVTRRLLERLGYGVIEAADSESALLLCRTYAGDIHLLLTDLVMPLMSGAALSEQARAVRPHLRVVYMSGYGADMLGAAGLKTPFLQKPFEILGLATALRHALER